MEQLPTLAIMNVLALDLHKKRPKYSAAHWQIDFLPRGCYHDGNLYKWANMFTQVVGHAIW